MTTNPPGASRNADLQLRRENLDSPAVQKLFAALNAEVSKRYPEEGDSHFRLDAEEIVDGSGIGGELLRSLEAEAHDLAVHRILPESGKRQDAALAMYERAGFRRVARFGEYATSALSVCLAKDI